MPAAERAHRSDEGPEAAVRDVPPMSSWCWIGLPLPWEERERRRRRRFIRLVGTDHGITPRSRSLLRAWRGPGRPRPAGDTAGLRDALALALRQKLGSFTVVLGGAAALVGDSWERTPPLLLGLRYRGEPQRTRRSR